VVVTLVVALVALSVVPILVVHVAPLVAVSVEALEEAAWVAVDPVAVVAGNVNLPAIRQNQDHLANIRQATACLISFLPPKCHEMPFITDWLIPSE